MEFMALRYCLPASTVSVLSLARGLGCIIVRSSILGRVLRIATIILGAEYPEPGEEKLPNQERYQSVETAPHASAYLGGGRQWKQHCYWKN